MTSPILLAVPNVSEGRDLELVARIGAAFAQPALVATASDAEDVRDAPGAAEPAPSADTPTRLLDVHSDADHHRSVFTLAGRAPQLADALVHGAAAAVRQIDVVARYSGPASEAGAHPHVGAIDVIPLVYFDSRARGAACAEALVVAERIGSELGVPVFLYGELAGDTHGRTRAELRRGGIGGLSARMGANTSSGLEQAASSHGSTQGSGPLRPDFGPPELHASAGATLVAAREPLVAFNLQLQPPAGLQDAQRIAAQLREGGEHGLPGLRAIGVALSGEIAQVSMNVERPLELPLGEVVRAVAKLAPVASAELVGLAPRAAFDGFPAELTLPGFDPDRHLIESALGM